MKELIVVGVDGSDTAATAVRTAYDLAAAMGATLHIVTAFGGDRTEEISSGANLWAVSVADEATEVARRVAAELSKGEIPVQSFATRGKPGIALINHAEQHEAKLLVVGNKNMQGLGRVLGSVANTVVHNAPCDVYIVQTHQE